MNCLFVPGTETQKLPFTALSYDFEQQFVFVDLGKHHLGKVFLGQSGCVAHTVVECSKLRQLRTVLRLQMRQKPLTFPLLI